MRLCNDPWGRLEGVSLFGLLGEGIVGGGVLETAGGVERVVFPGFMRWKT